MKLFGSPGTVSSLLLRVGQCLSTGVSFGFLAFNPRFTTYTVYGGLAFAMLLQVVWSFTLMCYDVYALRYRRDRLSPALLSIIVLGDWLVGGITLAAATSSAAVTVLFVRDLKLCLYVSLECSRSIISVALAFVGWILIAISALVMLWLRLSI